MDSLFTDLRFTLRRLRARPLVSIASTATLALGIGLTAAVFSMANWLMLRPVEGVDPGGRYFVGQLRDSANASVPLSYRRLGEMNDGLGGAATVAGYTDPVPVVVHLDGVSATYARVSLVSAHYFATLGVAFRHGSPFSPDEEDAAAGYPVVVISERLASRVLGDSHPVDAMLEINGIRARVTGVAGGRFAGPDLFGDVDLWIPGRAFNAIALGRPGSSFGSDLPVFTYFVGRRAEGMSEANLANRLLIAVHRNDPATGSTAARERATEVAHGLGAPLGTRRDLRVALTVLGAASGLVLLITCLNVGNLFLFAAVSSRRDWAVRAALGARRTRLARLQLLESGILVSLASAASIGVAWGLCALFTGTVLPGIANAPVMGGFNIGRSLVAVFLLTALLTAVLCSAVPLGVMLRRNVLASLAAFGGTFSPRTRGLRSVITATQIGLSLTLLVVMFLLMDTLRTIRQVDVGFDAGRVSAFSVRPAWSGHDARHGEVILRGLLEHLDRTPAIERAAIAADLPMSSAISGRVRSVDAERGAEIEVTESWVSSGYFTALGIPVLRGRTFEDRELFRPLVGREERVVIISERLARRAFGSDPAVGRLLAVDHPGGPARVIGVVADSRWSGLLSAETGPLIYHPIPSQAAAGAMLLVRSNLPPPAISRIVSETLAELAPSVPALAMQTLAERIARTVWQQRLLARLLAVFGLIALVVAMVGVYALMSHTIAERRRELGIRLALGATPARLLAGQLRHALLLGALGVLIGAPAAVVLSRLTSATVHGVPPLSLATLTTSALLLVIAAGAASLIAGRRAVTTDPAMTLRIDR